MNTILEVKELSKQYKHRDGLVHALKDISFSVEKGSFISITGPSGSGKTTLLLALSGLIRPTSGQIYFEGKKLETSSDKAVVDFRKKHVGFIMQNFSLIPYMTSLQNVMVPLSLNGMSLSKQKLHASALLNLAGLGNRLNHFPREISVGQQQRVAIARALANNPSIIFADEPTGNLDPSLAKDILGLLKDINREKNLTIFLVTHSPLASDYGNIKIRLKEGQMIS